MKGIRKERPQGIDKVVKRNVFKCLKYPSFSSELNEIRSKLPRYPARLNTANFGRFGHCFCICEKPGQVPCPSRCALPEANKPKWWQVKKEETA